jgi:hypothetical protein
MNYERNGKGLIIYAEQLNALYLKISARDNLESLQHFTTTSSLVWK